MPERTLAVEAADSGERLDLYLSRVLASDFSRTQLKKMILEEKIKVGERPVTPHYKIKEGDSIWVIWPEAVPYEARAEDLSLPILFEDESLIVVNKPAGMVVHPAHGNLEHTMVNALLFHIKELSRFKDTVRPGIVHRLDKDTSGVLVVAKNDRAHRILARQFKVHTVERVYQAVVKGRVEHEEGFCDEPVGRAFFNKRKVIVRPSGGKNAQTFFKVLRRFRDATHLEIRPKTGRTHQIRVHMAFLGHPVFGDLLYGIPSDKIDRQALHAKSLGFVHPETKEKLFFDSELPRDIQNLLDQLASEG